MVGTHDERDLPVVDEPPCDSLEREPEDDSLLQRAARIHSLPAAAWLGAQLP